jgi:signal peptidase I
VLVRVTIAAAAVMVAAAIWMVWAPAGLGGQTQYVTVTGASMEPRYEAGDLVLLRRRGSYGIGDVVAFRERDLRRVVLHRIVGRDGGAFITKGDANAFRDPARPRADEIIGAPWISVPAVGGVLATLRQPVSVGVLVGAIVLLSGGLRQRRRRRPGSPREVRAPGPPGGRAAVAVLSGATGLALALLAIVAYALPSRTTAVDDEAFRQSTRLSYRAEARPGDAYPAGRVPSGAAVFTALTDQVRFDAAYELSSDRSLDASGRFGLTAVLSDGRGWSRRVLTAPARRFDGTTTEAHGALSLRRLRAVVEQFEAETGSPGAGYTLTVTPRAMVEGAAGGLPLRAGTAPAFSFAFDGVRLAPAKGEPGLQSVTDGTLPVSRPTRVSLGPLGAPLTRVRAASLLGAEGALGIAALLGLPLLLAARRSEETMIELRWSRRLVEVGGLPAGLAPLEVDRFAGLVTLADRTGHPILVVRDPATRYALVTADAAYAYTPAPPAALVGEPA